MTKSQFHLEMSVENCYDEIEVLVDAHTIETTGVKVVSGYHPKFEANVHIIIAPIGHGMMLFQDMPFQVHAAL